MNFIADEGVDRQLVERLRLDAHNVRYIAEMEPGVADESVLSLANREGALLPTADKDFGELVFRQRRVHLGVVLVRLSGLSSTAKAEIAAVAIREHAAELLRAFTVIRPGSVRIRRPRT